MEKGDDGRATFDERLVIFYLSSYAILTVAGHGGSIEVRLGENLPIIITLW